MIQIGKTYYLNLYEEPYQDPALHYSFEAAVVDARRHLSLHPGAKLLHILECSPIKGLEPLEMYP